DTGLTHLESEVADTTVFGKIGIGARDQHAEVAELRRRRPDLLTVDHELVAVAFRAALQAREVGARPGLAEELTPRVLPGEDAPQPGVLLLAAAGPRDRRPRERAAAARRR